MGISYDPNSPDSTYSQQHPLQSYLQRRPQQQTQAANPYGAYAASPQLFATGSPVAANGRISSQMPIPNLPAPLAAPQLPQNKQVTYRPASVQGTQFSQFAAPDQSAMNGDVNNAVSQLLKSGGSLNPEVLAQMKEQQKEQALLLNQQQHQQIGQSAAQRNLSGGGSELRQGTASDQAMIDAILSGNRNLDVQAAQTNRGDMERAASLADAIQSGQLNRATQGYNATLNGQQAQQQGNLATAGFNADQGFKGYQSEAASQQAQIDNLLKQFDVNKQAADVAGSNYDRGIGSYFQDRTLNQNADQFDKGYGLNIFDLLERARQADNNLGFNYNQLDQQGQSSLMSFLQKYLQ